MPQLPELQQFVDGVSRLLEEVDFENLPSLGPLLERLEGLVDLCRGYPSAEGLARALKDVLEKAVFEEIPPERAKRLLREGLAALKGVSEGSPPSEALLQELKSLGLLPEEYSLSPLPEGRDQDLQRLLDELAYRFLTVDMGDLPALGEILQGLERLIEGLSGREDAQELASLAKRALERAILEEVDAAKASKFVSDVLRSLQGLFFGEELRPELRQQAIDLGILEAEMKEEEDWIGHFVNRLDHIQKLLLQLPPPPYDPDMLREVISAFRDMVQILDDRVPEAKALCQGVSELLGEQLAGETLKPSTMDLVAEAVDILKGLARELQELKEGKREGIPPLPLGDFLGRLQRERESRRKLLGEVLLEQEVLKEEDLREAFEEQKRRPEKKLGEILLEKGKVSTKDIIRALREQGESTGTVTVEFRKLSKLTDLVGELAVLQAVIRSSPAFLSIVDLKFLQDFEQMGRIISELQKTVMSLRMEPLRLTFERVFTFARELADTLGKAVEFEIDDRTTEIEAEMAGPVYEVLTRILRAIIEESVEPPEEREKAGKPPEATVKLLGERKISHVLITLQEDGKGFDPETTLIREAHRIIETLHGTIEINPKEEGGTLVALKVPLGLVVVDGLLSKVGEQWYIIPSESVKEVFLPKDEQVVTIKGRGEVLRVRKELLPFVDLRKFLGSSNDKEISELTAVVVEYGGRKFALLVEEIVGKQEVVVKTLGKALSEIRGIVGGTIMGDGSVGLILEPEEFIRVQEEELF